MKHAKQKKFSRIVLIFAVTVLFLVTSLPMTTLAETLVDAAEAEQALLAEIDAMLACERKPGEIVFDMEEGIDLEEARTILGNIGVPNDFEERTVYLYRSFDNAYSQSIWFVIRVSEDQIRNMLFALRSCEQVSSASPNHVSSLSEEEIPEEYGVKSVSGLEMEMTRIDTQIDIDATTVETLDPETSDVLEKIGVTTAWEHGFRGSTSITIGVLDSGYNPHDDIWSGYIDTARARNFGGDSTLTDITDESGHGTFVIGQICASVNGIGVNGVCKYVKIVPIKITYYDNDLEEHRIKKDSIKQAIEYAQSLQLDIVNYSNTLRKSTYLDIQSSLESYTGLFVAAAGNKNTEIRDDRSMVDDNSSNDGYANHYSNWIIVGNSTADDKKAASSNYSEVYVDLFAPGVDIRGVDKTGSGLTQKIGTSMAAPHVSAAAALIMSHATHLSPSEVKQLLMNTVIKSDDLEGKCVSGGRLSISGAVFALYDETRPAYSNGDVNGNGEIDVRDYMMAKRIILGTYTPSANESLGADANGDGSLTPSDYNLIKRHYMQLLYCPPE